MPFNLADLIVESVLRDGFTALRRTPTLVPDIFSQLNLPWTAKKYGQREINRLQSFFCNGREVSIVHSFNQVPANLPCISIQLMENSEAAEKAGLEDFRQDLQVPYTSPQDLAARVISSPITVTAYDALSGLVSVSDDSSLALVTRGQLFQDYTGAQFRIVGGVLDVVGTKQFFIAPGSAPNIVAPGEVVSPINFHQYTVRGIRENERLILGIHTTEALLTKYLYIVVKHTLESRKPDLELRGLQEPTFQGSDFSRNLEYPGDQVYSRFLTVSGFVENTWTDEEVIPVDDVEIQVTVPMATATTAEAGLTGMTVQIQDTPPDYQEGD